MSGSDIVRLFVERSRQALARTKLPFVAGFDPARQTEDVYEREDNVVFLPERDRTTEFQEGDDARPARVHGKGAVALRRYALWAAEVVLALAAAAAIAVGVLWWRLSQGPIELNSIRESVEMALSDARSGRPVTVERVELAWSERGGAVQLRALNVTFEDQAGAALTNAQEARIQLAVLPLLIGRVAVVEADFTGGELSMVRKPDGQAFLMFGPTSATPDIVIPAPPPNETLEQRVNRMIDGLAAAFRPVGAGGQLRSISASGVRLTVLDEGSGAQWTAQDAHLSLERRGQTLQLISEARLEGASGLAPARFRVATDTAFQSAIVEFETENARPRALFSPAMLGPFAGLDAPLSATVTIGLDRQQGVTRFEGEATLGRGVANMAGGQFRVDGGRMRGRYDIENDVLVIDQVRLAGASTRIQGEIRVRDASTVLNPAPGATAPFSVEIPSLTLDAPAVFARPVAMSNFSARGVIGVGDREITFDRLRAQVGAAQFDLRGRYYWSEATEGQRSRPGLEIQGAMAGVITPSEALGLWPRGLGEGARDYLMTAMTAGQISNASMNIDIRPNDFAAEGLRNEAVDVRFNYAHGEMRFIPTMSPLQQARGHARLQGNRFDAVVDDAFINGVHVTSGSVEAPRIKPKGAMLTVVAQAEGGARPVMELLMQQPLSLGQLLPIRPETVSGNVAARLTLQRPMLSDVPFEDLRFQVEGNIDNFSGQMSTRPIALSHGQLQVRGDQRAVTVTGPVRAGGSNIDLRWTETIRAQGPSSRYQISGNFSDEDLIGLGFPVARMTDGVVGVTISGLGRGFDVENADIELDLRQAAVTSPFAFFTKRVGTAAAVRFHIARQRDSSLLLSNIDARGAGMTAQGSMRIAGDDGRILEADIPRLAIQGRSDARISARTAADGGLDLSVRGPLFDAAPFMDGDPLARAETARRAAQQATSGAATTPVPVPQPIRASVIVDRLKMRGGATLEGANADLSIVRGAIARLNVTGRAPAAKAFALSVGPQPGDAQSRVRFNTEDAGFAVRALLGAENVVGGTASAEGDWRTGPPSQARFTLHMRDFEVVQLPAMARLLSSAGSLTGLVEMLNGDGIGFRELRAPITYTDRRITIGESRASGASMGLTASGAYDIPNDNLDIDGVLVPSYGLNSVLGHVPLIGDVLVGRRGEGVFGVNFSVNGPALESRVGVNPLSVITPGILRRIFDPFTSRPRPEAEPPAPAETAAAPPAAAPTPSDPQPAAP